MPISSLWPTKPGNHAVGGKESTLSEDPWWLKVHVFILLAIADILNFKII